MEILLGIMVVLLCVALYVISHELGVANAKLERELKAKDELTDNLKMYYKPCRAPFEFLMKVDFIPTTPEEAARLADLIYIINTAEIVIKRPIAWKLMRIDGLSNEEIEAIAKGIRNYERTPDSVYQDIWRIAIVNWNGEIQ